MPGSARRDVAGEPQWFAAIERLAHKEQIGWDRADQYSEHEDEASGVWAGCTGPDIARATKG